MLKNSYDEFVDSRRETILAFLKTRGHATLGEIAAHLEVSKQGALRHLETLEEAGLATVSSAEAAGPGRPEHVYKLTAAAGERFPDGHRELTAELVDFMSQQQLREFFARRAARLEAEYAPRLAGLDFEARVRELARLATEHGHMAEVVEVADGVLAIRHCNCPIQDVAARTGLPCINEQQMYERLLGTDIARTTWMAESADDCTYVIKEGSKQVG